MALGYIDANLNDVNQWDGEFSPVEEGDYVMEVDSVEQREAKSSGAPMLAVKIRIVSLANGDPSAFDERLVFANYMLTGKARSRLKQFVVACDCLDENGGFEPDALVGKRFLASVIKRYGETLDENGSKVERVYTNVTKEQPLSALEDAGQEEQAAGQEQEEEKLPPPPPPPPPPAAPTRAAAAGNGKAKAAPSGATVRPPVTPPVKMKAPPAKRR